jgi:hypothetical protein
MEGTDDATLCPVFPWAHIVNQIWTYPGTTVQFPAVKHVGIGGSHIHNWRSAQSTSHPISSMLTGDRELTCIYFGSSFIYLSIRYLRVYKLMATVHRTQYRNLEFQGE